MRVSNFTLLLEVSIPIIESKKFSLYKVIPIPIVHKGAMFGIKTGKKNILANIDSKEYMEISENELDKCVQTVENVFMCQTMVPTIVSDFNACEADILFGDGNELPHTCDLTKIPNATYVSEINKLGVYIITPNKSTKIRTICSDTRVSVEVIEKQVVLTAEPNCVVRVGRYRLRQNGIYLTNHTQIGNVEVNFKNLEFKNVTSVNLTSNITEIALMDNSNDFSKLIQEAEALEHREKDIKKIEKLETDYSVHTYSILGLSTTDIIIITFIAYIIVRTGVMNHTLILSHKSHKNYFFLNLKKTPFSMLENTTFYFSVP